MNELFSRGLLYTAAIVFNRIVPEWLFRFRVFRVYRLHGENRPEASVFDSQPARCEEDWLDVERVTHFTPQQESRAGFAAYWVRSEDVLIGGGWLAFDRFDEAELGLRYELQSDQAWLFAVRIAPPHRRRGAYRHLLAELLQAHRDQRTYAAINPTNRASLAAHRWAIESEVGWCVCCRLVSLAGCWSTGGLATQRRWTWQAKRFPLLLAIRD